MNIARFHFCSLAIFCAGGFLFLARAHSQTTDWSIAQLNHVLAAVPPGQTTAQVGDMVILVKNLRAWRNQLAGTPGPLSAFDGATPKWTDGNIYYTFDALVSAPKQQAFLDAAAEWAMMANLRFIARTTQANYMTVLENAGMVGGQSAVGMIGGQQYLQVGPAAWNRPTLCHELGHTLGLIHEHQRSDRDSFVTVFTDNLTPGQEGNFIKLGNSQNVGAYDFLSIMHYNTNTFSLDPATLPTVYPLPAYLQFATIMGAKYDPVLSFADRAGMAAAYGAATTPLSPVVTNTADSGPGTLRGALYYALDYPGTTITFNIPTSDAGFSNGVFNILPTDGFPSLVSGTMLDGSTEPTNSNPNGPEILLNGQRVQLPSTYASGLKFTGSNCTARGFIVSGFPAYGVLIDGTSATGNTVAACYLGVNPAGTAPAPNGLCPLQIANGATWNTAGGALATDRNVISGSLYQGLVIRDAGTHNNTVSGNYIGLNAAGTAALSNTWSGVAIFGGAQSNRIGGASPLSFNIISGNGFQGVTISDTNSSGNVVDGNYFGLNPAGTAAIPNGWAGVDIFGGASGNFIGSAGPGVRNVLSGNGNHGVGISGAGTSGNVVQGNYIGLNAAGTAALSNAWNGIAISGGAQSNRVGGASPLSFNIISGNGFHGVAISDTNSSGNVVDGNYIGLNPAGTAAIPNGWAGVAIFDGASGNFIGSAGPGVRNVLSGNGNHGVAISGPGTSGNVVQANYIGLNATGTAVVSNTWVGVAIFDGAQSNLVGVPGWGNVICGNGNQGIALSGDGTKDNVVAGNYLGVSANGLTAFGNNWAGVAIFDGAQSNRVGGTTVAARNVISGNKTQGVVIGDPDTRGNVVAGNYIGVNPSGTAALGNSWAGVDLFNGPDGNIIGGTAPGARNVISGNGFQGVLLQDFGTRQNSIQGNLIGLNAAGNMSLANGWSGVQIYNGPAANLLGGGPGARNFISGNGNYGVVINDYSAGNLVQGNTIGLNAANRAALPNAWTGVALYSGAVSNQIGGVTPGAANLIAGTLSDGVQLYDEPTTNNSVRGNSIFNNYGAAIALYNSANANAVAPVLTSAVLTTHTTVAGSLTSAPDTTFQVDFYADAPPAASAEGMTYLGSRDVTTSAGGTVNFTVNLGALVPGGRAITASATDPAGNTSPLSSGVAVTITSSVNDNLPNAWRALYFGGPGTTTNAQSCANCDPDGDGMNNRAEFLAGTNPTNAASRLTLVALTPDGTGDVASFLSSTGVVYRLEVRDDAAIGDWEILADQVVGTGASLILNDPNRGKLPKRFYRAEVLW